MNTVSIIVLVVLAILTLVQVMRISEVSSEIQGGKDNEVSEKDNDTQGRLMLLVGFGFIISGLGNARGELGGNDTSTHLFHC